MSGLAALTLTLRGGRATLCATVGVLGENSHPGSAAPTPSPPPALPQLLLQGPAAVTGSLAPPRVSGEAACAEPCPAGS